MSFGIRYVLAAAGTITYLAGLGILTVAEDFPGSADILLKSGFTFDTLNVAIAGAIGGCCSGWMFLRLDDNLAGAFGRTGQDLSGWRRIARCRRVDH